MAENVFSTQGGPIYFWREYESDVDFLSQWYTCPFTAPSAQEGEADMTFVTAEQYMMYRKAMTFSDVHIAAQIMKTSEPKKQKGLGRQVKNFDAQEWEKHRELVVEEGNWNKFTRSQEDPKMADKLLATGERLLVEASPFDKIWGIGFSAAEAKKNKERWGMNLLGQCLMRVRTRLQEQQRDDQQEE